MSKPSDPRQSTTSSLPIPKASRGGAGGFIRDVRRELARVEWPTPKETTRLTGVVLAVVVIMGVSIWLMSLIAETLIKLITR